MLMQTKMNSFLLLSQLQLCHGANYAAMQNVPLRFAFFKTVHIKRLRINI